MAFDLPSLGALIGQLVRDARNRLPNKNWAQRSDNWHRLANMALAVVGLHRHLQVIDRDALPDTAAGAALDRHGAIYGVLRKAATAASKADALRITGTVAAAFTVGDQLAVDGIVYQVNETGAIPAAGYADVDVLAVSTGAATRKTAGTVMTFLSTPVGLDETATLQLDLDGGSDKEEDGAYRVRILDMIAMPGMGGNANDYRQWAKTQTFVGEAYVWPLRGGLGSVHMAALREGVGAARILSGGENTTLETYIDSVRPVDFEDFYVLTVVAEPTDVELLYEPEDDAKYEPDWSDAVPLVVATWTAGTRTLEFTTARPADMAVGDRVVYKNTAGTLNSGKAHRIEAFGAADEVILAADAELTTSPPAAGNAVYAGGELGTRIYDVLVAHMNALGPGRPDSADPTRDYSYGSSYWEGTLRQSKLRSLAQRQDGCLDTELLVPGANVTPANAAPVLQVGLITPRQVIVRRAW